MFPYGDDPRSRRTTFPLFTILLLLTNIAIFVYQVSLGLTGAQEFVFEWGFVPSAFWAGERLYTILTSLFLHGGLLHVASNMVFLAIFGPNVEDQLGRRTFILFYLAGGILASLVYAIAFADLDVPLVGASGAIAAVLGGYVLLFPRAMIRSLLFAGPFVTAGRVAAVILIGFWFLLQLIQSVVSVLELAPQENVAFLAHAAGFVFGIVAVGAIREARDQTITHWERGNGRWWNRSFRNWILLIIFFASSFVFVQFLRQAGFVLLPALIQSGVIVLAGLIAIIDGWWRLSGRRGILGSTQRAERAVAIIQIMAGIGLVSSIVWA